MAVISSNPGPGRDGTGGDPLRRLFVLKAVTDEPAWLLITRAGAAPTSDDPHDALMDAIAATGSLASLARPEPLVLRAKVGHFGNPDRERALLRALTARLEALRGVDWHPLPD